jgi:hypothetical protein
MIFLFLILLKILLNIKGDDQLRTKFPVVKALALYMTQKMKHKIKKTGARTLS